MKKILVICGVTSSGKTSCALSISNIANFSIISIDSRQIYSNMDIGTGKDIPAGFKKNKINLGNQFDPYIVYQKKSTLIWGYDLTNPSEHFSTALFIKAVSPIIEHIHGSDKIPILVGGSGLYLNEIVSPSASTSIPLDKKLRKSIQNKSLKYVQALLNKVDQKKYISMNRSDKYNPRRLIRAIEIAKYKSSTSKKFHKEKIQKYDVLKIGLDTNINVIDQSITNRVHHRIRQGMSKEVEELVAMNLDWSVPALSATGYKEWREYLEGKISKQTATNKWIIREKKYARRQITWFKKQSDIIWIDNENKLNNASLSMKVKKWLN